MENSVMICENEDKHLQLETDGRGVCQHCYQELKDRLIELGNKYYELSKNTDNVYWIQKCEQLENKNKHLVKALNNVRNDLGEIPEVVQALYNGKVYNTIKALEAYLKDILEAVNKE